MDNRDFIDAYKGDIRIISDYYKIGREDGSSVDITGIVNPLRIDNRQLCAPTDQQGDTPHCAGYSACTLVESLYWKATGKLLQFDSHQVYALAKMLDGEVEMDGTYLEESLKAVLKLCRDVDGFGFLNDAKIGTFFNQKDENTIETIKYLIHRHDIIQAGFSITSGWYDCNERSVVIEHRNDNIGGHAVNLCGYDVEHVYILNQWGMSFGSKGFAMMRWEDCLKELMYVAYLENIRI